MAAITNQGQGQGQNVKDKVKDAGHAAADKAKDVADKAGDMAGRAYDKAGDLASKAYDKAGEIASNVGDRADSAVQSAGGGLQSAADSLRGALPRQGMLGSATESVAGTLESGGKYLEDKGLSGMADDITGLIKRNPVPAVLIALGVGYLIASATRS